MAVIAVKSAERKCKDALKALDDYSRLKLGRSRYSRESAYVQSFFDQPITGNTLVGPKTPGIDEHIRTICKAVDMGFEWPIPHGTSPSA